MKVVAGYFWSFARTDFVNSMLSHSTLFPGCPAPFHRTVGTVRDFDVYFESFFEEECNAF